MRHARLSRQDAAHVVPPTNARSQPRDHRRHPPLVRLGAWKRGDESLANACSDTALRRVWRRVRDSRGRGQARSHHGRPVRRTGSNPPNSTGHLLPRRRRSPRRELLGVPIARSRPVTVGGDTSPRRGHTACSLPPTQVSPSGHPPAGDHLPARAHSARPHRPRATALPSVPESRHVGHDVLHPGTLCRVWDHGCGGRPQED